MKRILYLAILLFANAAQAEQIAPPLVDHHTHLFTRSAYALITDPVLPSIEIPEDLARLLRAKEKGWNDAVALRDLYTDDAMILYSDRPGWIRGKEQVVDRMAGIFSRAYFINPISCEVSGSLAQIAGYFTRGEGKESRHFGHILLSLKKGTDSIWRIAAETLTFPGPTIAEDATGEQLLKHLDREGIQRAVVLSTAYWFGSARGRTIENEYEKVRAENDWVANQVTHLPDRLIGFCSFNPLKPYALKELERCAKNPNIRGLKLHFGDSGVDVLNPQHLEKAQQVFRAANEKKLPIVIDLWTGEKYGAAHSEIFLNKILPLAPDIPVQIAHLAASGPGYHSDDALEIYAKAAVANDPRLKNVYFDVASIVTYDAPGETLALVANRLRQLGLHRVLYGSDRAGTEKDRSEGTWDWTAFRRLPLSEDEFRAIARNAAPYIALIQ